MKDLTNMDSVDAVYQINKMKKGGWAVYYRSSNQHGNTSMSYRADLCPTTNELRFALRDMMHDESIVLTTKRNQDGGFDYLLKKIA